MPNSGGTSGSRRGTLAISPAARYRELRVNRTVYLTAFLLLLAPWALWFESLSSILRSSAPVLALQHTTVAALMRENLQGFALGTSNPTMIYVLGAAVLGIALFAYDRLAGGLLYSLEGPLRRREVFAAKALFGAITLLVPVAAGTAGTLLFAALSGNPGLAGAIALRGLFDAAGELSLLATALALGGAMSTVFSVAATATWALLPALLQSLLMNLFWAPGVVAVSAGGQLAYEQAPRFAYPWIGQVAMALPNLSPFQPAALSGWPLTESLALLASFIAWAALMLGLGSGWWERAPFERLRDSFFFPFLWNLYYAFLSLLSTLILGALITRGEVYGAAWAAIYLALFVMGWFFWRFVVIWRAGRADRPRQARRSHVA